MVEPKSQINDDAKRFGLEIVEDDVPSVLPENVAIVEVFYQCGSCWLYSPAGNLLGLDYSQVEALLRLLGVKNKKQIFKGLMVMERVVVETK